jgi:ribosome biogenesis GTPase / thiamine phosphate phosphatase
MDWHDAHMPGIDIEAFEDAWDDDMVVAPRGRQLASPAAQAQRDRQTPARVVAVDRGRIRVALDRDGVIIDARYGGAMRGRRVVVGDRVRVASAAKAEARIVERLDRTSVLRRTGDDMDRHERVVVANVDRVAVVVGSDNLEAGLRFTDRVIVAATAGGAVTTLVVNKIDLIEESGRDALDASTAPYVDAVDAVLHVSTRTGEGMERLRDHLVGAWTTFTGHSGVGKSSLFNLLVPDAARAVGEIGPRGGRHTTVAAIALPLPARTRPTHIGPAGDERDDDDVNPVEGWLVDTPGVRSFGLGMLDRRELAQSFPELRSLDCALDDCNHAGEPGCALPEADVHAVRIAAFHRLAAALERGNVDDDGYPSTAPAG